MLGQNAKAKSPVSRIGNDFCGRRKLTKASAAAAPSAGTSATGTTVNSPLHVLPRVEVGDVLVDWSNLDSWVNLFKYLYFPI